MRSKKAAAGVSMFVVQYLRAVDVFHDVTPAYLLVVWRTHMSLVVCCPMPAESLRSDYDVVTVTLLGGILQ